MGLVMPAWVSQNKDDIDVGESQRSREECLDELKISNIDRLHIHSCCPKGRLIATWLNVIV